jgi:TonB-linked SusC/RagA family outer membrane protein
MMRTITKTNSLPRRRSHSYKWIAAAGIVLFLGNYSEGHPRKLSVKDTTKVSTADTLKPVPVLFGIRPFRYITSAISYMSGSAVSNIPGTNRTNSLSGQMAGLTIISQSGLPSTESNIPLIRGVHSFSATTTDFSRSRPVVLINGRRDDDSEIEPNDIESVTVLKDAAATALYGLNSANGVILITTKRGHAGRLKVEYNMETSFEQPTRLPKFLDSYNYATLYNEAQLNDNPAATPAYSATALQGYQAGTDPYLYPNVNWVDELLKKSALQVRNNINISGGGDRVAYYFSGGYLTDNGIFKTDKSINSYGTNSNLNVFNVRGNVDINLSKNLLFSANLRSKREMRNAPGGYNNNFDQNIFKVIYTTPNNAYPIRNADGSLGGKSSLTNNPYALLNYSGYSTLVITSLSGNAALAYNFDDLVKGLKAKVDLGVANFSAFQTSRTKTFAVYAPLTATTYQKFNADGSLTAANGTGGFITRQRIYDHSASVTYDRDFGDNSLSVLAMYQFQQSENDNGTPLTQNNIGPKGRLSYRYKNRYLLDFVAAYQGSEQYPVGQRYGFFPAISAGWIVSDESFMKNGAFDFLKIRGSYGKTGNPTSGVYFDYLNNYSSGTIGGVFNSGTPAASTGIYQSQVANPNVTWETSLKGNIGLDIAFMHNRLNASIDVFKERTSHINVLNPISVMYGSDINSPVGIIDNKGFEVQASWNDNIGKLQYSVSGNLSVAKNIIVNQNEPTRNNPWMYVTGNTYGVRMGYVFDRLFTEADIAANNFPNQSLLGVQKAGDLKYKDLNGDGKIDFNDVAPIGASYIPEVNYGVNFGFKYQGFDLTVNFQGTSHSTTYNAGANYWEFYESGRDNVTEHLLSRWTPNSGQSAAYPRLTLSNPNNFVTNSYWVQDNSYIRLKYTELGFTIPGNFLKKIGASSTRIFVNGYNLLLWSDVKEKDPESPDNAPASNGFGYPLQRSFSLGLNVKF